MNLALAIVFGATFGLKPIASEDSRVLEPSVRNEVDHAVSAGERWLAKNPSLSANAGKPGESGKGDVSSLAKSVCDSTNGLSHTQIAIKLVSSQSGEGWWTTPTNAAPTRAALKILKGL